MLFLTKFGFSNLFSQCGLHDARENICEAIKYDPENLINNHVAFYAVSITRLPSGGTWSAVALCIVSVAAGVKFEWRLPPCYPETFLRRR